MRKTKYLIIGAGVTGLGFANFIQSDDYVVVERETQAGGYCKTIYKDDFVWDYAGHFFHFANVQLKQFFNDRIPQEEIIYKEKNTKIFYNDSYIDYPFQKNIHQLPKDEFIDCLFDLFNRTEKDKYLGFEDMLYGKFGKSITNKFLKPYNEKLYACNLNDLDADAMGRFFPYADIREIVHNMKFQEDDSYNKEFLYPKKGAITFINALLRNLVEGNVLYGHEVLHIDVDNKVATTSKERIAYEYLINTSPMDKLISCIDHGEYMELKNKLTYNKVLVFNLGFDKKSKIKDVHWIYVPDKNINFYRLGFYDNILNTNKLSLYVEIGYPSGDVVDTDRQLALTLENLKKIGIISDHALVAFSSVIMDPAYVHISEEGKRIRYRKKREYQSKDVYTIGRYGDWKYCSIEDSMMDAMDLAKELNVKNH